MEELNGFRLFLIQEQSGRRRVRSLRTVELHVSLLKRLRTSVPDLSPEKIILHLMALFDEGRKGTYLNDYIDTLRIYGRFKGTPIFDSLKHFPEEEYEKTTLSDKEIEDFLTLPPPVVTRGKATYVMGEKRWAVKTLFWKILAYTGMRPGEVASLRMNNVDFGRQIFLAYGKTGKRNVPIPEHLLPELSAYIGQLKTDTLFPTIRKTANSTGIMSDVVWGEDFHRRIKRLGIRRNNLTPYSLRHSFITRLLSEDVNLFKVQKIVGHRRIETTAHYTHLTTKDMIQTLQKDPMNIKFASYEVRFRGFRELVKEGLKIYTTSLKEEKRMINDLKILP